MLDSWMGGLGIPPSVVFGFETGGLSSLLLILDWLAVVTGRESYLQITHGRRTLRFILVWFLGGGIVGGLGTFIHLYEQTPQAALLVALTWRTFLDQAERFLRPAGDDVQKPQSAGVH
jgi:hypothetical protein